MKRVVGYLYYVVLIAAVPLASRLATFLYQQVDRTFQPLPYAYLFYLLVFAFGAYLFLGRFLQLSRPESLICKAVTAVMMFLLDAPTLLFPLDITGIGITNVVVTSKLYFLPILILGWLLPSMVCDIVGMARGKKQKM